MGFQHDFSIFLTGLFIGSAFKSVPKPKNSKRVKFDNQLCDTSIPERNPYMILMIFDSLVSFPCCRKYNFDDVLANPNLIHAWPDMTYYMFPVYPYSRTRRPIPPNSFMNNSFIRDMLLHPIQIVKYFKGMKSLLIAYEIYIIKKEDNTFQWIHKEIDSVELNCFIQLIISLVCFKSAFLALSVTKFIQSIFPLKDMSEIFWLLRNCSEYNSRQHIIVPESLPLHSLDISHLNFGINYETFPIFEEVVITKDPEKIPIPSTDRHLIDLRFDTI